MNFICGVSDGMERWAANAWLVFGCHVIELDQSRTSDTLVSHVLHAPGLCEAACSSCLADAKVWSDHVLHGGA